MFDWSRAATWTRKTSDVRWEIDFDVSYPLYKHLGVFFFIGYFRRGDVYARPDGSKPKPAREFILGGEVKF